MFRSTKRLMTGQSETGSVTIVETANLSGGGLMGPGAGAGLPGNTGSTSIASPAIELPLLDGFMSPDMVALNRMFHEIYRSDAVAGVATDMLATLPFSDFSLVGMNDERRLQKYAMAIERMRVRSQLPVISTDFMVFGRHISVMNWNERERIYDALLPQNVDYAQIQPVPIAGADPLVKLAFPQDVMQAINNKDPRMKQALDRLPEKFKQAMMKGGIDLNPDDLLYIARPGTSGNYIGMSAYERLLPVWLIEKALYRGTLDQSWKRQRPIMHITAGDLDWTPLPEEFQQIAGLFANADNDPTGAIVTTRDAINVNEIRRGDDMWKITDIADWATKTKLMALGISENFLTGDGTINAMDNSLSVILQYFTNFRDNITREVFYDKNFPTIARENGFFRRQNLAVSSYQRYDDGLNHLTEFGQGRVLTQAGFYREMDGTFSAEFGSKTSNEGSYYDNTRYEMPRVHWHNSLKGDSSRDYMDMLTVLEEKGVPIPIRSWAAAGGMNIKELVESQKSDARIREQFLPWVKDIKKYKAAADPNAQPDTGFETAKAQNPGEYSPSFGHNLIPWFTREFGNEFKPYALNYRDQPVPVTSQRERQIEEQANRIIAESAAGLHAKNNHSEQQRQESERQRSYHYDK